MYNRIMLIGNLVRDPEGPRQAGQGSVTTFRIACSERIGEGRERNLFIDVECWNRLGEVVSKYMSKGRRVFVEGRLRLDEWGEGEERRSKYFVNADVVRFLDGRGGDGEGDGDESYGGGASRGTSQQGGGSHGSRRADDNPGGGQEKSRLPDYGLDDDVPF